MIQSILFFSLGFLCAGFLALMVAPALWRRAVLLTRRRIEASVPLTLNEIQADKDRIRAEFAMSTRRLEMSIKSMKDKATAQLVEINRNREELKALAAEQAEKNEALSMLEAKGAELRSELRQREEQLRQLSERAAEYERMLEERAAEIEKLGRMYDEASFASSSRQIELAARESEVAKLSDDIAALKGLRSRDERRAHELSGDVKAARDALKAEKKRTDELEAKLHRAMSTLADREDKLDRRDKELANLRGQVKASAGQVGALEQELAEQRAEKLKLEADFAKLSLELTTLMEGATGTGMDKAIARMGSDRARLEQRLSALTRENRKLKSELTAHERIKSDDWDDERRENALLREQLNDLAAEVINLTALLEGPASPINAALSRPDPKTGEDGKVTSLADRVRALQRAASAG